jgi:hypothetical protein
VALRAPEGCPKVSGSAPKSSPGLETTSSRFNRVEGGGGRQGSTTLHELSKQSCQGKAERKKAKEVSQRRKRSKLSDFKAQADEQKYDFR